MKSRFLADPLYYVIAKRDFGSFFSPKNQVIQIKFWWFFAPKERGFFGACRGCFRACGGKGSSAHSRFAANGSPRRPLRDQQRAPAPARWRAKDPTLNANRGAQAPSGRCL
jgi:hypothetical protein